MKGSLTRLILTVARRVNRISGGKLSQIDPLLEAYKWTVSVMGGHRIRYRFDGYELLLDASEYVQRRIAERSLDHELSAFHEVIEPGDTVYDVGANIGIFTISAAARYPTCDFIAIEPEPNALSQLRENIRVNEFEDRITCLQKIASDMKGVEDFYISESNNQGTHSLVERSEHHDSIKIETITLDAIANEYTLPDVVKIDVEGTENLVLEGMADILDSEPTLLIDVHERQIGADHAPSDVFDRLFSYGEIYRVTPRNEKMLLTDKTEVTAPETVLVKPTSDE